MAARPGFLNEHLALLAGLQSLAAGCGRCRAREQLGRLVALCSSESLCLAGSGANSLCPASNRGLRPSCWSSRPRSSRDNSLPALETHCGLRTKAACRKVPTVAVTGDGMGLTQT